MLTPRLGQLKSQISAKPKDKRTSSESELLAELESLDESEEIKKALVTERMGTAVFAGPSTNCGCCGRAL